VQSSYEERWFDQTLDHFRFTFPRTKFRQRYLFNDQHWGGRGALANGCPGPILFYTGNEGPIEGFWNATGFMTQLLAPKWGALLVHAEERYYGESLPFGNRSFARQNVVYLTTEQVLADYVALITHLKSTLPHAKRCPVVAFGGSYGAKLTAYLRIKYPHVVIGGLASSCSIGYSAPAAWESHGVDEFTWIDIVNAVYDVHPECLDAIGEAVRLITHLSTTAVGRKQLEGAFHLCKPLTDENVAALSDWFTDAIETIPQLNYPYPVEPFKYGWPVNHTCSRLTSPAARTSPGALLAAMSAIASDYYGWDGATCMDGRGQGGIPGGGPVNNMLLDPIDTAWGYQSCTETLHQFSARGVRNFTFEMAPVAAVCSDVFGAEVDTVWPDVQYGGYSIMDGLSTASNIIFSQGLLDPWHGGGFLKQWDRSMPVLLMKNAAHHLDLRAPHPEDPPDVTATRMLEESIIRGWIDSYVEADVAKTNAK